MAVFNEGHTGVILECKKASLLCNSLHGAKEECFSLSSLSTIPLPWAEKSNFFFILWELSWMYTVYFIYTNPILHIHFLPKGETSVPTPTFMSSFRSWLRPFSVVYIRMLVVPFTRVWSLAGTTSPKNTAYPSCPGCQSTPARVGTAWHCSPSVLELGLALSCASFCNGCEFMSVMGLSCSENTFLAILLNPWLLKSFCPQWCKSWREGFKDTKKARPSKSTWFEFSWTHRKRLKQRAQGLHRACTRSPAYKV